MVHALLRSSHPGPTVVVSLIAAVLAAGVGLEPWRVAVVTLMILCNQLSIGLSNDWLDAARDRHNRRFDKPIASGEISSAVVAGVAITLAATSVALSALLGPLPAVAHAVFLASGWLYNLGLKSTAASVVPYIVGFGSLPAIVTLAADPPELARWWALFAGALLGVAAHFSNVLPDLDDDSATGVRGLPHRLGARLSGIIIALSLIAAPLTIVWGPGNDIGAISLVGLAITFVLAGASIVLVIRNSMKRLLFRITIAAALVSVALLLLSAPQLA
ncbi:UbiA family prenyltransferase [Salinibacterium sp. M195]|uniref:UbiA family prenyltransferase n=1 Tax=Salinibacterium sp. M195 TaxID=2583374 RepID=UPI001C6307D0|nr:UbiA family prenyltransferase [Salinibacterium sp. M195]QYH35919.1 1,4-dihydroxy-2-naphthoate prenyltransferase [Salinibacterium sp. M195]